MDRRTFAGGLIAAPALLGRSASAQGADPARILGVIPPRGPIDIRPRGGRHTLIRDVALITRRGIWGWDVRGDHPQFNENRQSIGGQIGNQNRPTIDGRRRRMRRIGHCVLFERSLVLLLDAGRDDWRTPLLIGHRNRSWEVRRPPEELLGRRLAAESVLRRFGSEGEVYVGGGLLMVLVEPVFG